MIICCYVTPKMDKNHKQLSIKCVRCSSAAWIAALVATSFLLGFQASYYAPPDLSLEGRPTTMKDNAYLRQGQQSSTSSNPLKGYAKSGHILRPARSESQHTQNQNHNAQHRVLPANPSTPGADEDTTNNQNYFNEEEYLLGGKNTPEPTPNPQVKTTPAPTPNLIPNQTISPTPNPTLTPTKLPTPEPTQAPTLNPTIKPTTTPTPNPEVEKTTPADAVTVSGLPSSKYCDLFPLNGGGHNVWDFENHTKYREHVDQPYICGPKVLIIGSMKCGTNTLGDLLAKHPRVAVNRCEHWEDNAGGCDDRAFQGGPHDIWEGHDISWRNNVWIPKPEPWLDMWAHRLPWTDGVHNITIDKSPSYFSGASDPETPGVAHKLLPNAKIAISVCNPAERLYSEFHHYYDSSPENREVFVRRFSQVNFTMASFKDFYNLQFLPPEHYMCKKHPWFCVKHPNEFLRKGNYASHLKMWTDLYGKENVLVVNMNESKKSTAEKLLKLVGHEILPPGEYPWDQVQDEQAMFQNKNYGGRAAAYKEWPAEMKHLEQYYSEENTRLAEMIGEDFPLEWNKASSKYLEQQPQTTEVK